MNVDYDALARQFGGLDPSPANVPIKPSKWNNQETHTPGQILQETLASQGASPDPELLAEMKRRGVSTGAASVSANYGNEAQPKATVDYDALAKQFGGLDAQQPTIPQATAHTPFDDSLQAGLIGLGHGVDSLAAGAKQAVRSVLGDKAVGAVDWLGRKLGMADSSNLEARNAPGSPDQQVYSGLQAQHPLATAIGEAMPQLATANPLAMAGMGALDYGTPSERATRGALGFAGGKVGEYVGRGLGRVLGGPASEAVGNASNQWGIPLTTGQASGSKVVKTIESVLDKIPLASGPMQAAKDRTFGAFNDALGQTFGAPAGTTAITPEVLGAAKQAAGSTIGDLAGRTTLNVDPQFAKQIAAVSSRATDELTAPDAALVQKRIDLLLGKVDPTTGSIPGQAYQASDSTLGKMMKSSQGSVVDVLGDLRSAARDAMDRSISPEDSAVWQKARHDYFNVKQVANATRTDPTGTSISPAQLLTQVNLAQRNARFGGGNDLAQLAQWAKPTIGDAIPDSGTAQRLFYQKLITNPGALAAGIGGGIYGADKVGVSPWESVLGLLALRGGSRALAGKPLSNLTKTLLANAGQGGGLLAARATPMYSGLLGQGNGQ